MSADQLSVQIVTPEGVLLDGLAEMVEMPALDGQIGVLPGHLPVVTGLGTGELTLYIDGEPQSFALAGGYAEIGPSRVRVLATFAVGDSGTEEVNEACERARAALEASGAVPPDIVDAEIAALSATMLHIAEAARKRGKPGSP